MAQALQHTLRYGPAGSVGHQPVSVTGRSGDAYASSLYLVQNSRQATSGIEYNPYRFTNLDAA